MLRAREPFPTHPVGVYPAWFVLSDYDLLSVRDCTQLWGAHEWRFTPTLLSTLKDLDAVLEVLLGYDVSSRYGRSG